MMMKKYLLFLFLGSLLAFTTASAQNSGSQPIHALTGIQVNGSVLYTTDVITVPLLLQNTITLQLDRLNQAGGISDSTVVTYVIEGSNGTVFAPAPRPSEAFIGGPQSGVTFTPTLGVTFDNLSESYVATFTTRFYLRGGNPNSTNIVTRVITINRGEAPLPVSLISFSAFRQSAQTVLTWATASEKNNSGFEVQASADGLVFETLATVVGAGNSTSVRNYSYADGRDGLAGTVYYRLRQVDYDGTASFSPVKTVKVGGLGRIAKYSLAGIEFDIRQGETPANITVTDLGGRVLRNQSVNQVLALPDARDGQLNVLVLTTKEGHRYVRKTL